MRQRTFVCFIHGLKGSLSISADTVTENSNEGAVRRAANENEADFKVVHYQRPWLPYPLLSVMGKMVSERILDLQDTHGHRGLVVASLVGAGVFLQSLKTLANDENPLPDVLFVKPVFNPLGSIEGYIGKEMLDKLKHGEINTIHMPTAGNPADLFHLTRAHLEDEDALRTGENWYQDMIALSQKLGGRKIPCARSIVAEQDPLSPPTLSERFAKESAGVLVETSYKPLVIEGADHTTPISEFVKDQVSTALASHWGKGWVPA